MVTFNQPLYLLLAFCLVPGFLLLGMLARRLQNSALDSFGRRSTLGRFSKFSSKKTAKALIIALSLAALAIAAAEPMLSSGESAVSRTLNAVIVMDVSRSMLAEDGPGGGSRLQAGILSVEKLFEAYPDGRFGLVVYTNKVSVFPPVLDHTALSVILGDISQNYSVRGEGSDPTAALSAVAELLETLPYTVNTVFLISDGGKSLAVGAPRLPISPVMRKLKSLGVHLVIIGVGGPIPVAIPVYATDGALIGYHQYQGATVYTALDESPLLLFAKESGGFYLRLTDPNDPVGIARSKNLDLQPVAAKTSTSLVWLPVVLSILLTAFWLHPRPA